MAIPQLVSVSPVRGPGLGGELVRVVVRDAAPQVGVWLGGRPVVPSAREERTEGTVLWLVVPPLVVGEVLLEIENLDLRGQPIAGERAGWRSYEATPAGLVHEGVIVRVTRALLHQLRDHVVASVRLAVAVDFDDDLADGARVTPLEGSPGLTLGGPTLEQNRLYAPLPQSREELATPSGTLVIERAPGMTVDLIYEVTGSSQRAVELLNLMAATATWLGRTRWLTLARDPADAAAGAIRWELDAEGGFRSSIGGSDGVHVFSTQIRIRGVTLDPGNVTGVVAATDQTQLELSLGGKEA